MTLEILNWIAFLAINSKNKKVLGLKFENGIFSFRVVSVRFPLRSSQRAAAVRCLRDAIGGDKSEVIPYLSDTVAQYTQKCYQKAKLTFERARKA